jgi:AcrR family transcriptional regulator
MATPRRDAARTRERLLEAAADVFAEKGFRGGKVSDICRRAGANVAAVNYHFGSKEALYAEAWKHAFHRGLELHPLDAPEDAAPAKRLHLHVLNILHRALDAEGREFQIVHKEIADPTGLLQDVMKQCIEPIRQNFLRLVGEIMGEEADDEQVLMCALSIHAQVAQTISIEFARRKMPGKRQSCFPPLPEIETLADHITRFSLAGIRSIARQNAAARKRRERVS